MDHELLRGRDRVVVRGRGAHGRRLRLPRCRHRVARYAGDRAHRLRRLAQHGDVRSLIPVCARPGRKASVRGALGAARLRPAHGRTHCTAGGLSGAGGSAAALALAASARGDLADRRLRSGRDRSRADRVAGPTAHGAGSLRSRRDRFAVCDGSARQRVRVVIGRRRRRGVRDDPESGRSASCDRGSRRLADAHGHGGELSPAVDVHAVA